MRGAERIFALTFGSLLLAAVVSPMLRSPPVDGFPLSNYPMFAHDRDRSVRIGHVIAFDAGGGGRPVPPELLGTNEVMQAHQTVVVALRQGEAAAADLCRETADAVRQAGGAWADAVRLQVRVDHYDSIAYFEGETRPRRSQTLATCEVRRDGA